MRQSVGKPQHVGGCLGKPFALAALECIFLPVRKLRKLRKLSCSLSIETNEAGYKPALVGELCQRQDARNDVQNIDVDLSRVVIKPKPSRLIRPSEQHTRVFAIVVAFKRPY